MWRCTNGRIGRASAALVAAFALFAALPEATLAQQPGGGFVYRPPQRESIEQLLAQGDRLAAARKYQEALAIYERVADRDDEFAGAYQRIGAMHMALGQPKRAIAPLRRAAKLARDRSADWIALGDACRAAAEECAEEAYLEALRVGPSPEAARAIERLGYDPFAHSYDYAPHMHAADDFHPAETRGPALALGVGSPYGGFIGLQLGYYLLKPETPFALAPYVGFGLQSTGLPEVRAGFAAGVALLYGKHDRWLLDLGYGVIATQTFELYGVAVDERGLYGVSLAAGREWMWSTGILLRALIGLGYVTDSASYYDDRLFLVLGLGVGLKPW